MSNSSLEIKGDLKGRLKEEKFYMITDSKLNHIESLAERAETFIKQEPKWDKYRNGLTASWAVGSTVALTLLSSIGSPFCSIIYVIHGVLLICSIVIGSLCFWEIRERTNNKNNTHDSYLDEIKSLLKSLREDDQSQSQ